MKVHAIAGQQGFDLDLGKDGVLLINGRTVQVDFRSLESGALSLLVDGRSYEVVVRCETKAGRSGKESYLVEIAGHLIPVRFAEPGKSGAGVQAEVEEGAGSIESPMPGRVVGIKVSVGQEVKMGEGIVLVEAMKMENELTAPKSGKVKEIKVKVGEAVEGGQLLLVIE